MTPCSVRYSGLPVRGGLLNRALSDGAARPSHRGLAALRAQRPTDVDTAAQRRHTSRSLSSRRRGCSAGCPPQDLRLADDPVIDAEPVLSRLPVPPAAPGLEPSQFESLCVCGRAPASDRRTTAQECLAPSRPSRHVGGYGEKHPVVLLVQSGTTGGFAVVARSRRGAAPGDVQGELVPRQATFALS